MEACRSELILLINPDAADGVQAGGIREETRRWFLDRTPQNRTGQPGDIAGAALYLASPAGAFVTGQTLVVDGGSTIHAGYS